MHQILINVLKAWWSMVKKTTSISSASTKDKIRCLRLDLKETQTEFWARFGVTQSQGSRFEQGMDMPSPLTILLLLYLELKVSDNDLQIARNRASDLMEN